MSTANLESLPANAYSRIFFYVSRDHRDLRSLLYTSKSVSAQISLALQKSWQEAIDQMQQTRPITRRMWTQNVESSENFLLSERIIYFLRKLDFAAFLKSRGERRSQSQSQTCEDYGPWLEELWDAKEKEYERLRLLQLRQELAYYQESLSDLDLFRAAARKGDVKWLESFEISEIERSEVDEAALLSLQSADFELQIFHYLLPYTSVYREDDKDKSSRFLTRLVCKAAWNKRFGEFESLIRLGRYFFYGEVLATLAKKNLAPQIGSLLSLKEVKIDARYIETYESQLGPVSFSGLHAAILEASLEGNKEAIETMLAHFPDSIPYDVLRHARDLLRKITTEEFGEENRPIYEKGHNRLYKHLPVPASWQKMRVKYAHREICRFLSKAIVRRFPDATSFQDEWLKRRGYQENLAPVSWISFKPFH